MFHVIPSFLQKQTMTKEYLSLIFQIRSVQLFLNLLYVLCYKEF